MTRLVPVHGPGRLFSLIFKAPLLFYWLGLSRLLPSHVLILTTTGRKSGKRRQTPLEYDYDPAVGTYRVMAGWAGRTDWYRNARANPHVAVSIGPCTFDAIADPMPEQEVALMLIEITRRNPGAVKIWRRWANRPLDGSDAGLREAAPFFPALVLRPVSLCPNSRDNSPNDC